MKGRLLLVIPTVALRQDGVVCLDVDFASNLRAYLSAFDHVTVACPFLPGLKHSGFPSVLPVHAIEGHERATIIELPYAYREDRYFLSFRSVSSLLRREISNADYLLFSPHAAFEWSTLAARIAIKMNRSYDIEADWDIQNAYWSLWRDMPWGPNKLRKWAWIKGHTRHHMQAMRGSSVALLQGEAVFSAYKDVSPNPHKVLNVQVTSDDYLPADAFEAKLASIASGEPLTIGYAGRVIDIKGPLDWIAALDAAAQRGTKFNATWFGEGERLDEARARVSKLGLEGQIRFAGKVDRAEALAHIRRSHLFLFCHMIEESPRCLVESLTCATPIIGYRSAYASDLVAKRGGGQFVDVGNHAGLASVVTALDADRKALATLVRAANETAQLFDRDAAIAHRIALIREFVTPPNRAGFKR